jgi:hypothetical protein
VSLLGALWDLLVHGGRRPPTYWHGEEPGARPYAPPIVRHREEWPGGRPGARQEQPYQPWPGGRP